MNSWFYQLCTKSLIYCSEWDNNECDYIRTDEKYMKCDFEKLGELFDATFSPALQDGVCESSIYNIEECDYEFGDCIACNALVYNFTLTGDGVSWQEYWLNFRYDNISSYFSHS